MESTVVKMKLSTEGHSPEWPFSFAKIWHLSIVYGRGGVCVQNYGFTLEDSQGAVPLCDQKIFGNTDFVWMAD